ncbi:kinase-like protein [Schizopora paradoxa]|uniref:Kinase-like protein n=1 Tax=Schizopora paradoxa TaxID=27342 RepID=A0A0H2RQH3_9AGAM|nr:kinase-like protein [Schizopora paradoxa]
MDRLARILAALSHLSLEGKIVQRQPYASGLGGSCDVYTAWSLKHEKKVAVKQIRAFLRKDSSLAKKLAKEIRIWSKLEHDNVLPLLGYFTEGNGVMPSLVSEWMEKGTLHDFMKSFPRGGIEACTILRDIASGLAYLHSKEVIHADLKAQNILISASKTPLLADFGLSLALSQSHSTMGTTTASTKGTVRWMAVELLPSVSGDEPSKHDKRSDVWAFGMVIYELLSWDVPFNNKHNDVLVLMAIVNGQVPEKPERPERGYDQSIFSLLWKLASSCWTRNTSRPTAEYIADYLTENIITRQAKLTESSTRTPKVDDIRDQLAHLGLHDATRYCRSRVWHRCASSNGTPEAHSCNAQLVEDDLTFDCKPTIRYGPIQSIVLNYVPRYGNGSDRPRSFPFEFGIVNSQPNGESGLLFRQFSVADTTEASMWVSKFEMIPRMIVSMKNASPDSMLGVVRRLVATEFQPGHNGMRAGQHVVPTSERLEAPGIARGHHIAEDNNALTSRQRRKKRRRRVRFAQDVTGELPTVIPSMQIRVSFDDDEVVDELPSPRHVRWKE